MKSINYILKGFGYENGADFFTTVFKIFYLEKSTLVLILTTILGTIRVFTKDYLGLDALVFVAFMFLIGAEIYSGTSVSIRKKGERIQSRKMGRMLLKIGVFASILFVLHTFSARMVSPTVLGLSVNPYEWLYYVTFTGIVFQLIISWFENLAALGYSEAKGLVGIILRKFNKWFEFDGSKNPDKNEG
jgi:hypothetical protein